MRSHIRRGDASTQDDLFAGTSLGAKGARDLAEMIHPDIAEAMLSLTSLAELPTTPAVARLVRAGLRLELATHRTAQQPVSPVVFDAASSQAALHPSLPPIGSVIVAGAIARDRLKLFSGRLPARWTTDGFFDDHPPSRDEFELQSWPPGAAILRELPGGIAANICYGLTHLGLHPTIVSAVGNDAEDLLEGLSAHGVEISSVLVDEAQPTAHFEYVRDEDYRWVPRFFEGASVREAEIDLAEVVMRGSGSTDLVLITSASTEAMLRHTRAARTAGVPFVADPTKRLRKNQLDQAQLRELIDGAAYLVCNEFERTLIEDTTGWDFREILQRVGVVVTLRGLLATDVERTGERISVSPAAYRLCVDPIGADDAFRSGFFGGRLLGLSLVDAGRLGCVFAAMSLETSGTQRYQPSRDEIIKRVHESYGDHAAGAVAHALHHLIRH